MEYYQTPLFQQEFGLILGSLDSLGPPGRGGLPEVVSFCVCRQL